MEKIQEATNQYINLALILCNKEHIDTLEMYIHPCFTFCCECNLFDRDIVKHLKQGVEFGSGEVSPLRYKAVQTIQEKQFMIGKHRKRNTVKSYVSKMAAPEYLPFKGIKSILSYCSF